MSSAASAAGGASHAGGAPASGGVWALIPARSFARGKSRLACLGTAGRARIARALFEHVCTTALGCAALRGVLVATDGAEVASLAHGLGAEALLDAGPAPLAAVIDRGLAALAERGGAAAVVLMADLPHVRPSDIAGMVTLLDGTDIVLAPDRDDLGTGALALRLPAPMATCFGHPDSGARHCAAATARGLHVAIHHNPRIAFDVDLPLHLDGLASGWRSGTLELPPASRPHGRP